MIPYGPTNAIQSATALAQSHGWTKRDLLAQLALGGRYPLAVGKPGQVAEELESWVRDAGVDGFNLTRLASPGTYEDFARLVVPELQSRGSYKREYAPGSWRNKLTGQGDRLPGDHAVAAFRPGGVAQAAE